MRLLENTVLLSPCFDANRGCYGNKQIGNAQFVELLTNKCLPALQDGNNKHNA